MRPKILHVIDHTEEGGAQVVIQQLIENLGNDYEFSVAVLGRSGRFSQAYKRLGVRVLEIGEGRGRWNPFPMVELSRAILRDGYDVIHTHLLKSTILGTLVARYLGRKTILHDHSSVSSQFMTLYFPNLMERSLYTCLYRIALRICHRIIVLTAAARTICQETYSINLGKIVVVPNGIAAHVVANPEETATGSIRNELGLSADTRIVMMVGRLEIEKDWVTYLRVAQRMKELRVPKTVFLVIGSGSEERRLRDYATEHKLNGVHFLGYREDVLRLLAEANVFLLTSKFEPFGIVLLEAMMIGCPIVATRSGGPDSILTHEFDSLLADVGDAKGLATNVVHLLQDEPLRFRIVRNAQNKVSQSYPIHNFVKNIANVYEQVLYNRDD